jgi:hypothetical protein
MPPLFAHHDDRKTRELRILEQHQRLGQHRAIDRLSLRAKRVDFDR